MGAFSGGLRHETNSRRALSKRAKNKHARYVLIETARKKDIKAVFAAPADPKRNVQIFADEIGADIVIIDPLATDWLSNMYHVSEEIYEAFR